MEKKIKVLNVMKYQVKETGKERTKVSICFTEVEHVFSSSKFRGISSVDFYFDGYSVFEKITNNFIDVEITGIIEMQSNPRDPLRDKPVLIGLITKNGNIDLL